MAEEVQDAARTLPQSMMWSINLNGLMGWLTAITFCYCIGDLEQGKHNVRKLLLCTENKTNNYGDQCLKPRLDIHLFKSFST